MTITVEEVRRRRDEMQQAFRDLVQKFERETGCSVQSVDLAHAQPVGQRNAQTVGVSIVTLLP